MRVNAVGLMWEWRDQYSWHVGEPGRSLRLNSSLMFRGSCTEEAFGFAEVSSRTLSVVHRVTFLLLDDPVLVGDEMLSDHC